MPDLTMAQTAEPSEQPRRGIGRRPRIPVEWRGPLAIFVWVQAVLLLWWAGQFPGMLSYDSTVYVQHVTTGPWTSDHSVLYDFFVLVSIKLCDGVWLLTLAQTTAWAATLTYFVRSVQMWGVRLRWAAIPAVILPLVPSFGAFTSMVWKDVGYALTEVLIAATLLRLLRAWRVPASRRRGFLHLRKADPSAVLDEPGAAQPKPVPWPQLAAVAAEFTGLVMFRNDGFLQVAAMVVVLFIVLRGLRVKVFAAGLVAAFWLVIANVAIYPAADIKPPQSSLAYGVFYSDIAVVYNWAPSSFTPSDLKIMRKVAPLSSWRAGGRDCFNGDLLRGSHHYSKRAADQYRHALAKIWLKTAARTPVAMFKAHLCKAAIGWNPFPTPWPRDGTIAIGASVPDNLFNNAQALTPHWQHQLLPDPLVSSLGRAAHWMRVSFLGPVWQVLIWRGAMWCYLAYLALIIAARRVRNWRLVFVGGAACFGNQFMVMAANPAQLYRYMVGPIFIGMMLIPLVAAARGRTKTTRLAREDPVAVSDANSEPALEG